ncbi:MAG: Uma2 family endonuclease [Solirubrobacteraceae bacterium]
MAVAQPITADEYLSLEDPRRTELVAGEVIVHAPAPLHQIVVLDVLREIDAWIRAAPRRGQVWIPLDVKLDERNVFAPDLLWYRDGRTLPRGAQSPSPLPDLAVEVRSPSTWRYDIGAKKSAYERHGLHELWLVDTAADVVLVFRRSSAKAEAFDVSLELAADDELTSPLLPGFGLSLRTLFAA